MSKLKLSKNLMQMKFMQRTKEDQESNLFNQNYNYNYLTKQQKFIFEPSFQFFEDLKFGRFSYRNMNPEVEKLMEEFKSKAKKMDSKKEQKKDLDDLEIDNKELAYRYKQFTNKKVGASNKRKRED